MYQIFKTDGTRVPTTNLKTLRTKLRNGKIKDLKNFYVKFNHGTEVKYTVSTSGFSGKGYNGGKKNKGKAYINVSFVR